MLLAFAFAPASAAKSCPEALDRSFDNLLGGSVNVCQAVQHSRAVLVVNSASQCGLAKQLQGLQNLHSSYADKGLLVLAVPTADFGGQEFASGADTAAYCQANYGVSFNMLPRSCIRCSKPHPVFAWMLAQGGEMPLWNFHKYLYDPVTDRVHNYGSLVEPEAGPLELAIQSLLEAK